MQACLHISIRPARRFCHPSRRARLPPARRFCHPARRFCHPPRPALLSPSPVRRACRPSHPARFATQPHAACLPSVPSDALCPQPRPTRFTAPRGAFVCTKKRRSKAYFAPAWWRRHPESNRGMRILQTLALPLGYVAGDGAGDGARTRHLSLGKAALYQMSYSRRSAATAAGLVHPQGLEPWTP